MSERRVGWLSAGLFVAWCVLSYGLTDVDERIPANARVLTDPVARLWRPDTPEGRSAARGPTVSRPSSTTYHIVLNVLDGYRVDPQFGDESDEYKPVLRGVRHPKWHEWAGLYAPRWNADGTWNY